MSPLARRTLWGMVLWLHDPRNAPIALNQLFTGPKQGASELACRELVTTGYLTPHGDLYKLTERGQQWVNEHGNPGRKGLEVQYLLFDDFRDEFDGDSGSHVFLRYDEQEANKLGVTLRDLVLALQALERAKLIRCAGMNGSGLTDSYELTDKGKDRCGRLDALKRDIELIDPFAEAAALTFNQTITTGNVGQFIAGHTVNVDQGDLAFGAGIPPSEHAELRTALQTLRDDINRLPSQDDAAEASNAASQIERQLAASQPEPRRITPYLPVLAGLLGAASPGLKLLEEVLKRLGWL